MAIGRSLTKKSSKYSFTTTSSADTQSKRSSISKIQISAPIELISTTNMISYTSPSLRSSMSQPSPPTSSISTSPTSSRFPPLSPSSSSASSNSGSDSEISSPDEPSPPPNHLSMYFAPAVPARRKSHRTAPPPPPAHPAPAPITGLNLTRTPSRSSQKMHSRGVRASNPFGAELAKVAEMAEDIGVQVRDAEEEFMMERGLQKFSANDYAAEIGGVFDDVLPNFGAVWI
ncbi:hypothetical protein L873DRAFT_747286 [Choiromyces venosus 120613-1]|uniref:Uncharacterized protein n=1 Tax=Choiromyces venosus 120613-1 TaxID=1336337 RepID=A0A3N4JRB2_9PEZI|nr:hypothetical protein L873DRAFT_747286 [Choiromyces venosus 120613-1]